MATGSLVFLHELHAESAESEVQSPAARPGPLQVVRRDLALFARHRQARRRVRRTVIPALGAALLVGLLPAQSLAMPPDPATIETGREPLEADPLELEAIDTEKPVEGETFEKDLDTLKATVVPPDEQLAPPGTTTPPAPGTKPFTFGSTTVSPAAYTEAATDESPLSQIPGLPIVAGQADGHPAPTGTWQFSVVDRSVEIAKDAGESLKVGSVIAVQAPAAGSVPLTVGIQYSAFQNLQGGDWASRLTLAQFPECYLTSPAVPACQEYEELETLNDPLAKTVTATVDTAADGTVAPAVATGTASASSSAIMQASYTTTPAAASGDKTVLGAIDSGVGPGGSFRASPLASSGKWSAGGSSGAFTWSYPMAMPPAPAGPAPNVTLSYNSQTVDGKTAVSSGQTSWIGEGWDYTPGFIERRYRTCKDDTHTLFGKTPNNATSNKTTDLCWASYNAVMSLGGTTTELVRDAAAASKPETEIYRPQKDDGTLIERITGGTNGDDNGERWKVTTPDGTQYHFGLNDVGGGHAVTNSVSTVPVFGNHPGEPCYQEASFGSSRCGAGKQQAWRWGLDKVEDVHGNVMIVNWRQEDNYYAVSGKRNGVMPEQYERSAYPVSIEYGIRANSLTTHAAKVDFTTFQRCTKSSAACNKENFKPGNPTSYRPWWDTPGSLNCGEASKLCPGFPSFWTQHRLRSVTTSAARPGQPGLGKVDTYTLDQSFPEDLYDTAPGMWLKSITRRGFAPNDGTGTLQTKDGVSFAPYTVSTRSHPSLKNLTDKQLPNLVHTKNDKRPGFTRPRIGTVSTEAGADIDVEYRGGCPVAPSGDNDPKSNNTCFPVRWSPDGEEKTPKKAWFNKYVVHSVTETDKVATIFSPSMRTTYTYSGPTWAASDDEFLRPGLRTNSDWRGYRRVTVTKGAKTIPPKGSPKPGDPPHAPPSQSQSTTVYFQEQPDGDDPGTDPDPINDSVDGTQLVAKGLPQYAGMTAETLTFLDSDASGTYFDNKPETKPVFKSRTRTFPEAPVPTASRARQSEDGKLLPDLVAYRVGVKRTDSIQAVGADWRGVRTTTVTRDEYGLPTSVETAVVEHKGTAESLSQQSCITTAYVHSKTAWLIGLPSTVRKTATSCSDQANADKATELIGSVKTRYDGLAHGSTPVKGNVTNVDEIDGAGNDAAITTTSTYDDLGRLRTVTSPESGKTETQYVPAAGGPVTEVKTINAKGHDTITTLDPGRSLPLTITDTNDRVTRSQYDALGRLVKGWSASRSSGTQTPSVEIAYKATAIDGDGKASPAAVTVKTLKDDGGYARQVTLYDGLMRQVQTQSEAHGPGRIITDTEYNDHGLVAKQTSGYLAKGEPATELFQVKSDTLVKSRVETVYDGMERPVRQIPYHGKTRRAWSSTTYGDTTTTVDTVGASTPKTITVTDALGRVTELRHDVASGNYRSTKYGYDKRGNRETVTDPAGNTWKYTFDARGRVTSVKDPDTGLTKTQYDNADRPTAVTDALNQTTYTTYDVLGRVTAVHEGSKLEAPVKAYTYDMTGALGLPWESKRHTATGDYITKVTGYDTEYRPTGRQVIIPSNAMTTGLSGTYTYGYSYTLTGKPLSVTLPAKGGLPSEKVITRYNEDGLPESTSGHAWYTSDVTYSPYGEVLRSVSSAQPYRIWTTNFIDEHSGRLMRTVTDREKAGPHRISDTGYAYDDAGMITASARQDAISTTSTTWDNQCFTYDHMGQLVNAWTSNIKPNGTGIGCKASTGRTWGYNSTGAPSSGPAVDATYAANTTPANLADASPWAGTVATSGVTGDGAYRQSFTYNWIGNRATMVEHDPTGDSSKNVSYTYNYSTTQPHTLTSISSPTPLAGSINTYNATGTTATRNPPQYAANQTLEWTPEQKLASNTVGTTKTSYVYDAEGNRLLEDSPSGSTLYLGETELTTDSVGLITRASRAYGHPGAPTVVRTTTNQSSTGHKYNVLLTDQLGTAHTTVEAGGTQPVTRRSFKPYGEARGTKPTSWPNKRSYLGVGIDDSATLLTHIGAREYDQNTGRFISADPIMDIADPLQMNGYTYANGNPVSKSDPTGLRPDGLCGGNSSRCRSDNDEVATDYHEVWQPTSSGWKFTAYQEWNGKRDFAQVAGVGWGKVVDLTPRKIVYNKNTAAGAVRSAVSVIEFALPRTFHGGPTLTDLYDRTVEAAGGDTKDPGYEDGQFLVDAISTVGGLGLTKGGGFLKKCHSFTTGTSVLMADGTHKKIEDVKIGDSILTTDIKTGKSQRKKVLEVIRTETDKEFTELTITTKDGESTIIATSTHPFWVPELDSWVDAGDLKVGQFLRASTGTYVQISATSRYIKQQRTHDLTIDDLHAYYVLAGATPVLVHNCGTTPPGVQCNCAPGTGAGPADAPIRNSGAWTRSDIIRGSLGLRPNQLGNRIEIHHADQMPGSAIHELDQNVHRGAGTDLHRNPHNQGVTKDMRKEDTQLHWWYRSQEQGWGTYSPDHWFDNWPG
ncbi:polymorphic toxin-type HINT domain-containing protein [Streptomyces sp. NPDC056144]|uniref:polymorphic toxin-type HINT domain-containing protein n=1 Tax=unclassified Streptomyces TaxID=2593676 RepID=UPI0035D86616